MIAGAVDLQIRYICAGGILRSPKPAVRMERANITNLSNLPDSAGSRLPFLLWSAFALLLVLASPVQAQKASVNVAVVDDGPGDRLAEPRTAYVRELLILTEHEFDVRIHNLSAEWQPAIAERVLEDAYDNPDIDMVLVIGFMANQVASRRSNFPKPTFLPVLLDPGLLAAQPEEGNSGIPNLNYLKVYDSFADDLDALGQLAQFDKIVLMLGSELSETIPALKTTAVEITLSRGVQLIEVTHDGIDHDLMQRVPSDTGAIFVAGLPRMPQAEFDRLVDEINEAGIPSYSFVGTADVERGLLMTSSETRDISRQARLNALNMQAVMLGGRAEDQVLSTPTPKRFTINMETARRLGVSPSFDILNASTLINQTPTASGQLFGLIDIANEAVARNQDLEAERYALQAGIEEIGIARANLLPQLGAAATYDRRKVSPLVEAGLAAEQRTDGALNLNQVIYSDALSANLNIQKNLQLAREASLDQLRLDVIQAATTAYYLVLNSEEQYGVQENNLRVTRRNLELAEERVSLGSSTVADVYRWQAEEARARILVLDARATMNTSWHSLNRILHRPQNERIALRAASFEEPFVMTRAEFDAMIRSPADYARFSDFFIARGLRQAPELAQVDAQIAAQNRQLVSERRSFWLPEFSFGGGYTDNFAMSGTGSGVAAGEGLQDWSIGLQATLPLFAGGARRARVSQADFQLRQLQATRRSLYERTEQGIREQLEFAQAAYVRIDLSRTAAEVSRKNYELVADAYARGTVSIIELLDAQEASLEADAASIDSFYGFLITIMALQRTIGGFDYLLPADQRLELADAMRRYLAGQP